MSLTNLLVPSFTQMLQGLSAWLDRAATRELASGGEADALLSLRLAADMFPLASQVRFACFQAQEPVYRLRDEVLPGELEDVRREGWNGGEQPGTFLDSQARISEAISFLGGLASGALDMSPERQIAIELPNGMVFEMTGEQYIRDWSLPQFYFHVNTAYAILRKHGVGLGKADYVSHMRVYLRPGSAPQS